MSFDNKLILLDDPVKRCMLTITEQIKNSTTDSYCVPPVAITSMARSGKTTLLKSIFNKILEKKNFNPILVSFNGNDGFEQRKGENQKQAFLRCVTTSLLYEKGQQPTLTVDETQLEEYLAKSPKPIVLLIDELNRQVDPPVAKLLRQMFLDKPQRYLCFTTNWFLNLHQTAGKTSTAAPSPRGTIFVHPPQTQSAEQIKKVMGTYKDNVTSVKVASCIGSVGLVVSIYGRLRYSPKQAFNRAKENIKSFPLEPFVEEFCTGRRDNPRAMNVFDIFTTRIGDGDIIWPICFAREFLNASKQTSLCNFIEYAESAVTLPSEGTGLPWEYVVRVGIGMVALRSTFRQLSFTQAKAIGMPLSWGTSHGFHIVQLPNDMKDLAGAKKHIIDYVKDISVTCPCFVLAYPTHGQFEVFDTITCFSQSKDKFNFTGQQMKHGCSVPTKDPPFLGVRIRGFAPDSPTKPTKSKKWRYLSLPEIKDFLPLSLHALIPSEWE